MCPTPDCSYIFEKDGPQFVCPICNNHLCIDCKVLWHSGMTCGEFKVSNQDESGLIEDLKR